MYLIGVLHMVVDYDIVSPLTDGAHVKYWVRLSDGRQGYTRRIKEIPMRMCQSIWLQ